MLEEEILAEIEKGFYRGCDYVDFTGGEPTLCTYLPKIISEIKQKWNMKSCVITNALCGKVTLEKFILAGVDDFLISTHGMGIAHDAFVQRAGARDQQEMIGHDLPYIGKHFCLCGAHNIHHIFSTSPLHGFGEDFLK